MTDNSIRTALITGGNGNLGRLVARTLARLGTKIVRFDIPGTENQAEEGEDTVVIGDIRDRALVEDTVKTHRPDAIFHLASLLSGSSEANPDAAWEINATASFHLLNLSRQYQVSRFFFASTAASYGAVDQAVMDQDYPQWPENLYGVTKIAVERLGV